MSAPSIAYFRSQLYIFHIFTIALPLLYYGIRGKSGKDIDDFGYTYLILLGGMALIYHGWATVKLLFQHGLKVFTFWSQ
jgi:hypothetical protein